MKMIDEKIYGLKNIEKDDAKKENGCIMCDR